MKRKTVFSCKAGNGFFNGDFFSLFGNSVFAASLQAAAGKRVH